MIDATPGSRGETQTVSTSFRWQHVDVIARAITLICGIVIVVGSVAPWAESLGRMDSQSMTIYGFWRSEGQLTFILGLVVCASAVWRTKGYRLVLNLATLIACGLATIYAIRVQLDPDRLKLLYAIHGTLWIEPRWGLKLVVIASVVGLLTSAVVVLNDVIRWRSQRHVGTRGSQA